MKKLLSLIFTALLLVSCGSTQTTTTTKPAVVKKSLSDFANSITSEELKEKLYIYASDEFQGRETGTPGQKMAIEFIKKRYVDLGIPSAYGGDNYYQPVPLEKQGKATVNLKINNVDFKYGDDIIAFPGSTNSDLSADEVMYVGYGISDDKYDSYEGIDVTGKIVLVKAGEPKNEDGKFVISGTEEASKWSQQRQEFRAKKDAAEKKGAAAVFYYNAPLYKMAAPQIMRMGGSISIKSGEAKEEKKGMNLYFVNTSAAEALLKDMGDKSSSIKMPVMLSYNSKTVDVDSENVVAIIKGSEKPEEYVVISSHLDHIGVNSKGEINNGADDDGSGSVSTIEIAEAFKMAADNGQGPKRSVVFLHVTGEEKGLLGSRYYTDMDPIYPLANTVANLNIDMIGRTDPKRKGDPNYIYLIGSDKLSSELHNISEEVNKKYTNMELDYTYNDENDPNRFYYRSDHYNFAKNNIPIIFYFNGTHDDYHRPSDTPDKIEYELMSNRAKLIFHTAWELANRPDRIKVDKAAK